MGQIHGISVDDQELGTHVDPLSVHCESDLSGCLLEFAAESDEWSYFARQGALHQP